MTNQSVVQGLFQDVGSMKWGHVECGRRGTRVAGGRVALTGIGGGRHVQWGRTVLVILAVAILIQWHGKALSFLSPVAEPNAYHLPRTALVF